MKRKPAVLSQPLDHQLSMYALAAGAAGVSVLAVTQAAEAKIIYTKKHVQIAENTRYDLSLNNSGTTDFAPANKRSSHSATHFNSAKASLWIHRYGSNSIRGSSKGRGVWASALPAGVKIGASTKFHSSSNAEMAYSTSYATSTINGTIKHTYRAGPWLKATNQYLGLKFVISGKTHYGWARLTTNCTGRNCSELLTGYAYETVANKGIVTGKTKGPDVITVERGSLGALAAGSVPVRRRKSD